MFDTYIQRIRRASREMVRELGLLLDETPYKLSLSFRHVLIELDIQGPLNQIDLIGMLNLDKSTVSRIIKKLLKFKLVKILKNKTDKRFKVVMLTTAGKETVNLIHESAIQHARSALKKLNKSERQHIMHGLELYANALKMTRLKKRDHELKT